MELLTSNSGSNTLEFEAKRHTYRLNGVIVPGVTTVNKKSLPTAPALLNWLIKNGSGAAKKSGEAADIGKIVHRYAELSATNRINEFDWESYAGHKDLDKIKACISQYGKWAAGDSSEGIGHEILVASPTHGFAGMIDRLAKIGDSYGIDDYKTSSGFYPEMFIQLAGYRLAALEWLKTPVSWLRILRFDKTGGVFHTMRADSDGWHFDGKLVEKDPYLLVKLEAQFQRNLMTMKFLHQSDELFERLNGTNKWKKGK